MSQRKSEAQSPNSARLVIVLASPSTNRAVPPGCMLTAHLVTSTAFFSSRIDGLNFCFCGKCRKASLGRSRSFRKGNTQDQISALRRRPGGLQRRRSASENRSRRTHPAQPAWRPPASPPQASSTGCVGGVASRRSRASSSFASIARRIAAASSQARPRKKARRRDENCVEPAVNRDISSLAMRSVDPSRRSFMREASLKLTSSRSTVDFEAAVSPAISSSSTALPSSSSSEASCFFSLSCKTHSSSSMSTSARRLQRLSRHAPSVR